MGKVKKKNISKVRETWILSQFTYGQSEEKKYISKVREKWILSQFTYGKSEEKQNYQ
jgi:hypothetical protein